MVEIISAQKFLYTCYSNFWRILSENKFNYVQQREQCFFHASDPIKVTLFIIIISIIIITITITIIIIIIIVIIIIITIIINIVRERHICNAFFFIMV